jgi:hypothetical protein
MNITLKDVLAEPRLRDLLRALLSGAVNKLKIPGALHFTYELQGDEIVVLTEDLDAIEAALSDALGKPVAAKTVNRPQYQGQVWLALPAIHKDLLLLVLDCWRRC